MLSKYLYFFFFQAEDGIRDRNVTGVQTCALPISPRRRAAPRRRHRDRARGAPQPRRARVRRGGRAVTGEILARLGEHVVLVGVSMALAAAVAIPLGIV